MSLLEWLFVMNHLLLFSFLIKKSVTFDRLSIIKDEMVQQRYIELSFCMSCALSGHSLAAREREWIYSVLTNKASLLQLDQSVKGYADLKCKSCTTTTAWNRDVIAAKHITTIYSQHNNEGSLKFCDTLLQYFACDFCNGFSSLNWFD